MSAYVYQCDLRRRIIAAERSFFLINCPDTRGLSRKSYAREINDIYDFILEKLDC